MPENVFRMSCRGPLFFFCGKETKNTILIFAACWILIQLKGTRLRVMEFAYLVVGHTHDLIDQLFAFIGKALRSSDVLCPSEMFQTLQRKMKVCPDFFHLTDFFDFFSAQPDNLSSSTIGGVSGPHNYRIFWTRDDSLAIQSKPLYSASVLAS